MMQNISGNHYDIDLVHFALCNLYLKMETKWTYKQYRVASMRNLFLRSILAANNSIPFPSIFALCSNLST